MKLTKNKKTFEPNAYPKGTQSVPVLRFLAWLNLAVGLVGGFYLLTERMMLLYVGPIVVISIIGCVVGLVLCTIADSLIDLQRKVVGE